MIASLSIGSLVLCTAVTACGTNDVVVGNLLEVKLISAKPNRDLDLLFVIDNSPSMGDKQTSLAQNFPRMIDKLNQLEGGLPNLHIGVVTSDLGTKGSAVAEPGQDIGKAGAGGCFGVGQDGLLQHSADPALTDSYLSDVAGPGGRVRNYNGELSDEFSLLAKVGDGGCGFEQHLAAMRRAFTNPANAGFVRPTANLAVVILADEDDCSMLDPALVSPDAPLGALTSFRCFAQGVICDPDSPDTFGDKHNCRPRDDSKFVEPIAPFIEALRAVKSDPRHVLVAGVVGDPSPVATQLDNELGFSPSPMLAHSCQFTGPDGVEVADPAVRIATFLDAFPGRSKRTSICNNDLTSALDVIGDSTKDLMGGPCLDTSALADTSPEPGIQPACEVSDVRDSMPDQPTTLPQCTASTTTDCFRFVADNAVCPDSTDHLRIQFQRTATLAADTWTHVRCQSAQP